MDDVLPEQAEDTARDEDSISTAANPNNGEETRQITSSATSIMQDNSYGPIKTERRRTQNKQHPEDLYRPAQMREGDFI